MHAPGPLAGARFQVKLRLHDFVARYYDGRLRCDEACGCETRNICCAAHGDAAPGTVSFNSMCTGRMGRVYTEADLYKQVRNSSPSLGTDSP